MIFMIIQIYLYIVIMEIILEIIILQRKFKTVLKIPLAIFHY